MVEVFGPFNQLKSIEILCIKSCSVCRMLPFILLMKSSQKTWTPEHYRSVPKVFHFIWSWPRGII